MRAALLGCLLALAACSAGAPSAVSRDGGSDVVRRDARRDGPRAVTRSDARANDATDAEPDDALESIRPDAPRDGRADAGASPSLVALRVAGAGALVPAFTPSTYDYYVRCDAGTNALTVSMTAAPGALSGLVQPSPASPSTPEQTLSVDVTAGGLVEAVATTADGAASTGYFVRCLPPDVPLLEMTTTADAGPPGPGYYLVGNGQLVGAGESGYAMILDGNGVPVWYSAPQAPGHSVYDVDSLKPGQVSFCPTLSANTLYPFELETLSATPPALTALTPSPAETTDHQDLRLLANGDYVVLAPDLVTGVDLTGLTLRTSEGDAGVALGANATIEDCTVLEIDAATRAVTWQWHASDHFDPRTATTYVQLASELDAGTPTYDVFHCSSIDVDPANESLLVSARFMNSVFYVDRASGDVVWKMGGAASSKDVATRFVSVPDAFAFQHDARLLPGWSSGCRGGTGQVSVFDDRAPAADKPSRAVIYDVVVGGGDGGATAHCGDAGAFEGGAPSPGTATVAWQYEGRYPSVGGGSVRVSPDGTRIVGWGISFGGQVFTEVDVQGNTLRQLEFPSQDYSYRAVKVPLSTFDLDTLRRSAGE